MEETKPEQYALFEMEDTKPEQSPEPLQPEHYALLFEMEETKPEHYPEPIDRVNE